MLLHTYILYHVAFCYLTYHTFITLPHFASSTSLSEAGFTLLCLSLAWCCINWNMFAVSVRIRAEKSEVLNEYEQNLERRVELLKTVCQNLHKKVISFLRSQSPNTDVEKRLVRRALHDQRLRIRELLYQVHWCWRVCVCDTLCVTLCVCVTPYVFVCMCTCTVHICLYVYMLLFI